MEYYVFIAWLIFMIILLVKVFKAHNSTKNHYNGKSNK